MTFEEWWDECMGWIEYEPDQYNKGMAQAAWEIAFEEGYKFANKENKEYDKIGV